MDTKKIDYKAMLKKGGESLKKNTMLIALIIVMLFFQVLISNQPGNASFFKPMNISNLINQNAYVVILATGMLLCILTGGNIDLSVGSVVCLVGAIAGVLIINMQVNIYLAIIICLIVGILIGAWQAYWIAYVRIPAFIVTLSGMLMWRGLANVILQGQTLSPFPTHFKNLFFSNITLGTDPFMISLIIGFAAVAIFVGTTIVSRRNKLSKGYQVESFAGMILKLVLISAVIIYVSMKLGQHKGFPMVMVLLGVVVAFYSYYTRKTVPGRHLYAVGGNEKAAKLSGIDTNRVYFISYVNMAFLAAVAALVCVARFDSASPSAGNSYEMDAIGSCFIGGASAYGGTGTVSGVIIGAIFMGVLNNGMSILGVDQNWQRFVKGLVLLAAVIFDVMSKRRVKAVA